MSATSSCKETGYFQQQQQTIQQIVDLRGRGLFTSQNVRIRFLPAEIDSGIQFQRIDLPGRPIIPASTKYLSSESRHTVLSTPQARVETIEHVMAALAGLEIDNCLIQVNMPEPPNCDGSALEFVQLLLSAQPILQNAPRKIMTPVKTIHIPGSNGSSLEFTPPPNASQSGSYLRIEYHLKYEVNSSIPEQKFIYNHSPENFINAIASARTFIEAGEIEYLKKQGFGKLTTHRDLVVFGPNGPLNETRLRYTEECARHKILDFLGDISLCGMKLCGHIKAYKSGHYLNHQLARTLTNMAQFPNMVEAA